MTDPTLAALTEAHAGRHYCSTVKDGVRTSVFVDECDVRLALHLGADLARKAAAWDRAMEALYAIGASGRSEKGICCSCGRGANLVHGEDCVFKRAYEAWRDMADLAHLREHQMVADTIAPPCDTCRRIAAALEQGE